MNIKISDNYVTINANGETKTFELVDHNNKDVARNEALTEVLEYLGDMEDELSKSISDSDFKSLPLNQYVTEANIFLLRSLIETIGYMKV